MIDNFTPLYPLKSAVLFLVFNRLDTTKKVFEAIQQAKPPRLYIASDGARQTIEGEEKKVNEVRDYITANIDWECEVKTLFREQNFGCGPNVKFSLDWFFECEEMGIILEDDCVPSQSFFWYCEELLNRYKNDDRIGMISGTNHIQRHYLFRESYTFSKYKACWGWACWRRSWKNMDYEMNWLNSMQKDEIIKNMGYSLDSVKHWQNAIISIEKNLVSAWDWQWYFSIATQNQLCIFPRYNLISNIGFGNNATHTFGAPLKEYTLKNEIILPLCHPSYIVSDTKFDRLFEIYKIKCRSFKRFIPNKLKNIIKFIIRYK